MFGAAGFFLLIVVSKKVPITFLQENPRQNPPTCIQQKSPTHFRRGAGPIRLTTIAAKNMTKNRLKNEMFEAIKFVIITKTLFI